MNQSRHSLKREWEVAAQERIFPARDIKFSKYEIVSAHCISRGEMQVCQQLHPKEGARLQFHTFVHSAIVGFAAVGHMQKTRQLNVRVFYGKNC